MMVIIDVLRIRSYPCSIQRHKHLQTHTGINRFSGTVEHGVLYNRQVFNEGTQFWGLAKIADEHLGSDLKAFLDEISYAGIVRLGTGRTRGMGKITLTVKDDAIQEDFTAFQQRLDAFQNLLQDQAAEHQLAYMTENYYFALTLHSPTILNDELLGYHGTIDGKMLADF